MSPEPSTPDGPTTDGASPGGPQGTTPLPPPPAFGNGSLADVMISGASLLRPVQEAGGLDLSDRLGLTGALGDHELPAGPFRNVCVVLVDGLGSELLDRHVGHAPTLRKSARLRDVDAPFPSTTAASLASLCTGVPPGQTGMVGYDVVDPDRRVVVNQLSQWDAAVDPLTWQPHPTIFQRLDGTADAVTVASPRYENSPQTRASSRGGEFIGAGSALARVSKAADRLNTKKPTFMYLYWPELDQTGHRHGGGSDRWIEALEELDSGMKRLAQRTGEETLILLTADHGMVNVAPEHRVDYSRFPDLVEGVELTAGEPRMVQLHLHDPEDTKAKDRVMAAWTRHFGDRAWILDREDLIAAGYFGPTVREAVRGRIGDVIIASHGELALYDMRRSNPSAMEMVGQHGSWTTAERRVPLVALKR